MPGCLGGGGAGGPGGGLGAAAAGASGFFSSAMPCPFEKRGSGAGSGGTYCSVSPPIMLMESKVGTKSERSAPESIFGSAASTGQTGARIPSL